MDNVILLSPLISCMMTIYGMVSMRKSSPRYLVLANALTGTVAFLALWHLLWANAPVVKNMHITQVVVEPGKVVARVEGEKLRGACCPVSALGIVVPAGGGKPLMAELKFQRGPGDTALRCRPPGEQEFGVWTWTFPPDVTPASVDAYVEHKCDGSPVAVRDNLGPWKVQP